MSSKLDLDDYLPYLLNRAGAKIADAFGKVTRTHGISLQMWRVLAALNQQDGQSVGVLSATTSIEKSTLSRLLDQMETQRLLLRRRDGVDQRSITIHRTPAAKAITEKLIPVALAYEAQALVGIDQRQATAIKTMLRQVYENLDELASLSIETPGRRSRATEAARRSKRAKS